MKVHLRMLGCRLNQSEIDTMARQLEQQGHTVVDSPDEADEIIVNTCAVTTSAGASSRRLIRELHRSNDAADITVTGCYSQISPDEIEVLPGVRRIVGNDEKDTLVSHITGTEIKPFDVEPHARPHTGNERPGVAGNRTRAFVKVQDGCDNECTFCVTTIARGDGRSRDADEIINEIQYLHDSGYQETVLTGVHLGSYGHDSGNRDGLMQLVRRILDETEIPRLRLSSLEPWDLSDGFFSLWQNERLMPHLHLPLQSGCDSTLRRMRRNTSQDEFRAIMESARRQIPDVRITSDVIVGFPGETDEEWQTSKAFIKEMNFAGMHVFRYSVRPGTPASRMKGKVHSRVKKERSQELLTLHTRQEHEFAATYIGQTLPVLWEQVTGSTEDGFINVGYTHNYIRVQGVHPRVLNNIITPATIDAVADGIVTARPVIEPVVQ
jgi:threonylcarbamoyladenosine tRNA methylthiotransferase MtaB